MSTKIVYTITLRNEDGTEATASTDALAFYDLPADKLPEVAQHQAQQLQRGLVATMEMIKNQGTPNPKVYKMGAAASK